MKYRSYVTCIFIAIVFNCCGFDKADFEYNNKYCYYDGYNDLTVEFKQKFDTIFIFYLNILENGEYINGYVDLNDYAGFFLINDIRDDVIVSKIKNYRIENTTYELKLTFQEKKLKWHIKNQSPSYLPDQVTLVKCE